MTNNYAQPTPPTDPNCTGGPPPDPPTESETDPRKVFDRLFPLDVCPTYRTKEKMDDLFEGLMNQKYGIHLSLTGSFWYVETLVPFFNDFHEFVCVYGIPVKTTWKRRHPGGGWGAEFYGAKIEDCFPDPCLSLHGETAGKTSNETGGDDVNLPLPQLLALLECPKIAEDWVPRLAQTSLHREQLAALSNLWQSLGRPETGFWPHIRVFCTRIHRSYAKTNNK